MDNDLARVWQLVHELSDQLALNQKIANTLQSQAGVLKNQAAESDSGFALKRSNTDISKETFDSELERTNAQIIIENQTLLHENKQLSALLKEYESTIGDIMTKFRNHALAAQKHELKLTRHYETLLLARESQSLTADLTANENASQAFQRLSKNLRALLRSIAGEDPDDPSILPDSPQIKGAAETSSSDTDIRALLQALDEEGGLGYVGTDGREDWALERECEIARLEKENEELRRLLEIDQQNLEANKIVVDEESLARLSSHVMRTRRGSGSVSATSSNNIGTGGLGMGILSEGYGQRSGNYSLAIGDGNTSGNGNGNGNGHQQQQQIGGNNISLLRLEPFGRAQRRPPMFSRGGSLRGGGPTSHFWQQQHPGPPLPERPLQQASNLDLSW